MQIIFTWIIAMNVSMLNCVCILIFVLLLALGLNFWMCFNFYFILASTSLVAMGIAFTARVQFPFEISQVIYTLPILVYGCHFFFPWRFKWLPMSFLLQSFRWSLLQTPLSKTWSHVVPIKHKKHYKVFHFVFEHTSPHCERFMCQSKGPFH
jgi:hypothetical protein